MARVINTVAAYRSLLTEEDADLKEIGVRKLLSHITLHWIDIANDIKGYADSSTVDVTTTNSGNIAFKANEPNPQLVVCRNLRREELFIISGVSFQLAIG